MTELGFDCEGRRRVIVTRGFHFSELWCGLNFVRGEDRYGGGYLGMMGMEMEVSDSRKNSGKEGEVHNTDNYIGYSCFSTPSLPLSVCVSTSRQRHHFIGLKK